MRTAAILLALVAATGPVRAAERPRVLVMEPRVESGLDPGLARLLDDALLHEFARSGRFEAVGGSDLRQMLALEIARQQTGCDSDSCLAEIAGALGSRFLAAASVGRVGERFAVNVKVIDVRTARVRRFADTPARQEMLAASVRRSVDEIFPRRSRAGAWVALGASAAATVAGLLFLRGALQQANVRNQAADPRTYDAAQAAVERRALGANLAFGAAAGAGVFGVVLALWPAESDPDFDVP